MITRDEQGFAHYEPPYLPGEVLRFAGDPGGTVAIEKMGTGRIVNWNGRAGDSLKARAGTEFRPIPLPEGWQGGVNYVYTLRQDGWLDFRYEPREQ